MVKRICSIVLSVLMCCSLMVPAFAEEATKCEHKLPTNAFKIDEAYCGHPGTKYFECELCHETVEVPIIAPADKHATVQEMHFTCGDGEDGYIVNVCTICGREVGDRVVVKAADHKEHKIVEKAAKSSTCSEKGNTFGKVCEFCGYVPEGSSYKEISLVPHTKDYMEFDADNEDTTVNCTDKGVAVYKCTMCDVTIKEESEALGHQHKKVDVVEATCSAEGNSGKTVCTRCGEYVPQADDNQVIAKNPDNHSWKDDGWKKDADGNEVKATCGKSGIMIQKCEWCGKTKEVTVAAKEHDYIVTTPAKTATCTEDGNTATYTCNNCGDEIKGKVIPAHHTKPTDPSKISEKAPTCSEPGYERFTCAVCGGKVDVAIPAKGHEWDDKNAVRVEATCETKGTYTVKCKTCGESKVTETPALGHEEKIVPFTYGDCKTPQTKEHKECARCKKVYSARTNKWYAPDEKYTWDNKQVSALDEYYNGSSNWRGNPSHCISGTKDKKLEAPKDPTCTETGHYDHKCLICGAYMQSDGYPKSEQQCLRAATGHKNTVTEKYEVFATCDSTGTEATVKCKDCGVTLSAGAVTPRLEHVYTETVKEANCAEKKNGSVTKTCHVKHKAYKLNVEELKKAGLEAKQYTVDGNAYEDKYYAKDSSNNRIIEEVECGDTSVTTVEYKHDLAPTVIKEPTCTEKGLTEWKCQAEGCTYKYEEETAALGHDDKYIEEIDSTCTDTGLKSGWQCARCGLWRNTDGKHIEADPRKVIPVDKDKHVLVYKSIAATCTENGKYGAYQCKCCGLWKVEIDEDTYAMVEEDPREIRLAYGHNWKEDVAQYKAPTYTEEGVEVFYCNQCGETYKNVLPTLAQNHTHDFHEVESKDATCTEDGYIKSECVYCDAVLTKTIKASGHKYTTVNAVAATCTTAGKTAGTICSVCGEVVEAQKTVPALGHKTVTKNAKKATYFAAGYTGDKVCATCGKVITKGKSIAKLKLAKPSIKVTAGSKKLTVKISKKIAGATGYEVSYKVKGGKKAVVKVYSAKSLKKVISKLSKGKTYTVKVRARVKSGSKLAYSSWSSAKTVKVK